MAAPFILLALVLVFAWFWTKQFVWLMTMNDASFSGRYDKLVWGVAFVFLFFVTPFAFAMWRGAEREVNRK